MPFRERPVVCSGAWLVGVPGGASSARPFHPAPFLDPKDKNQERRVDTFWCFTLASSGLCCCFLSSLSGGNSKMSASWASAGGCLDCCWVMMLPVGGLVHPFWARGDRESTWSKSSTSEAAFGTSTIRSDSMAMASNCGEGSMSTGGGIGSASMFADA